jgi:hypothetical protein
MCYYCLLSHVVRRPGFAAGADPSVIQTSVLVTMEMNSFNSNRRQGVLFVSDRKPNSSSFVYVGVLYGNCF